MKQSYTNKIAIVVPVYNAEQFIEKSYDNILRQSLKDWTAIYVDNNSADATAEKVKQLVEKDNRIQYRFESNQGVPFARNNGIRFADAEYLYFLDVDDETFPGAINDMITALDADPTADVIFGKMFKSDKTLEEVDVEIPDHPEVIVKEKPYWGLHWFNDLTAVVGPPAFLYRSTVFEKFGMYDTTLNGQEDTALDIKLGMLANVLFIDRYVYLYFKHGNSLSDQQKRQTSLISMMWDRMIKSNIPLSLDYAEQLPDEYYAIMYGTLLSGLVKIPSELSGEQDKIAKFAALLKEMKPYKVPNFYRLATKLYLKTGKDVFKKIILYKLRPRAVKQMVKSYSKRDF